MVKFRRLAISATLLLMTGRSGRYDCVRWKQGQRLFAVRLRAIEIWETGRPVL